MNKNCKGCSQKAIYISINTKGEEICVFAYKGQEHLCPCYECLVKVMCSSTCSEKFTVLGKAALGYLDRNIVSPIVDEGKKRGVKWLFRDK